MNINSVSLWCMLRISSQHAKAIFQESLEKWHQSHLFFCCNYNNSSKNSLKMRNMFRGGNSGQQQMLRGMRQNRKIIFNNIP